MIAVPRLPTLAATLLVLAPLLPLAPLPLAGADAPTVETATLPCPLVLPSAVSTGSQVYVFGGRHEPPCGFGYSSGILRYDPAAGAISHVTTTLLPTPRGGTTAVWTGSHAYVFGGYNGATLSDIVRFDPATGRATTMSARLPTGTHHATSVWTGTHAYVFGGWDGGTFARIVRYDPATDTATTMRATLPGGREGAPAVWDGTHVYLFGGHTTAAGRTSQILRYDPASDSIEVMAATMPTAWAGGGAIWDGTHAYVLGGSDTEIFADIVRYDPATDTVTRATDLPEPRLFSAVAWDGTAAFVVGGIGGERDRAIFRYVPSVHDVPPPDTRPPETYFVSATDGFGADVGGVRQTLSGAMTLAVRGTDRGGVAGFDCALDGAPFAACANPATFTGLAPGPHHASARARDLAGNVDATPITFHWVVIAPADAVAALVAYVESLGLPNGAESRLTGPLHEADERLRDDNAANDASVCGRLDVFRDRVESEREHGTLAHEQANALDADAARVLHALAC